MNDVNIFTSIDYGCKLLSIRKIWNSQKGESTKKESISMTGGDLELHYYFLKHKTCNKLKH